MVYLDLIVSVEAENVQEVFIEDKSFKWYFLIKCGSCNETYENEIYFTELDEVDVQGSRGIANFQFTCKLCKRAGNITMYKDCAKHITCIDGKGQGTLATFDCRGIDLVSWNPQNQLSVLAEESKTVFSQVDVSDLPWCDYDEKTQNTLQIEEFSHVIQRNNKIK